MQQSQPGWQTEAVQAGKGKHGGWQYISPFVPAQGWSTKEENNDEGM